MPPRVTAQSPRQPTTQTRTDNVDVWGSIDTLRLCVFGQSGSGKTTFWSTFPGPILVLICSGGNKPGELRSINTSDLRKKVTPRVLNSMTDFGELTEDMDQFQTIVLDHVTGMADLILKEILGLSEIPTQKGWGLAQQQQYGQQSIQIKETLRKLLNHHGNTVIVAQERTFSGKDDGSNASDVIAPTIGPALSPSAAGWLMPACDFVVHTFKRPRMETTYQEINGQKIPMVQRGKGVEYCLRTEPHDVFMTKFRLPKGQKLPDCIVDPTYDKLMKVIKGEK